MQMTDQVSRQRTNSHSHSPQSDEDIAEHLESKTDAAEKKKKYQRCKKTAKYIYVIAAFIFGGGLAILKSTVDPIDEWLDDVQHDILSFLLEENVIYLLLVIFAVSAMKSVGIKDVFGLRTISVILLSYKIVPNEAGTLILAMFLMGILSSISKMIEYFAIGEELQFVMNAPIQYLFKWFKDYILFYLCCKRYTFKWFDPVYTMDLSKESRKPENKKKMNIINNILRYNESDSYLTKVGAYILAILWTSCSEWIQPITELFLFANNWRISYENIIVILFAEFVDFDKVVESWYIVQGIKNGDLIDAKIDSLVSRVFFWMAGYTIILFPTLYYLYRLHQKTFPEKHETNDRNVELQTDIK